MLPLISLNPLEIVMRDQESVLLGAYVFKVFGLASQESCDLVPHSRTITCTSVKPSPLVLFQVQP